MADPEGREVIQNPQNVVGSNNLVWVILQPYKIRSQSSAGRRGTSLDSVAIGHQFKLLAPPSIMYSIGHTWGDYESIATRMLSKFVDVAKLKAEAGALGGGLEALQDVGGGLTSLVTGNIEGAAKKAEDTLKRIQRSVSGVGVVNAKVDTPLVYQSSERRTISLEFKLVATSSKSSAKSEVYDIVKYLEIYSCPDFTGDEVYFSPPYVFNVYTSPGKMININRAALESVQPTWEYPFDNEGYPMSCSLTLTFKDLSPLYRVTVEKGGIPQIKITSKPKS